MSPDLLDDVSVLTFRQKNTDYLLKYKDGFTSKL